MTHVAQALTSGHDKLIRARDAVGDFRAKFGTAETALTRLNKEYDEAEANFNGAMFVERTNSGMTGEAAFPSVAEGVWATANTKFDARFDAIIEGLDTNAKALSKILADNVLVSLPHRITQAYASGGASPALHDAAVRETFRDLGSLKMGAARHAAGWGVFESQAKAETHAQLVGDSLVQRLIVGDFTEEELADLERSLKNPWFAAALIARLGPRGLLVLPAQLAADDPWRARVFTALAQGLAGASQAGLLPGDYGTQLVGVATSTPRAAYGLSVLLHRGGKFPPEFASQVASGIYAFERAHPREGLWRVMAGGPTASLGQSAPDLADEPGRWDPMTGVNEMLSRDPATAQDFLLGEDAVAGGSRITYLTNSRHWDASDHGDSYGRLLEAATTQLRDHERVGSRGYKSAQIAGLVLASLPTTGGENRGLAYVIPEAMKDSIARIQVEYLSDFLVARAIGAGGHGAIRDEDLPGLPPGQDYGVDVNRYRAGLLLESLMTDPAAAKIIMDAELVLLIGNWRMWVG